MRLLIGGGGTGGHIYPGLALARYALAVDSKSVILFVGSESGLEQKIVPGAGFKLATIPARGFQRNFKQFNRVIGSFIAGIRAAKKIIADFKPDVVLGTGGFVAAPLVVAAISKRLPVVIHEQNARPGFANRLLAPFVDRVCVSFLETVTRLPRFCRIAHTGNPRATEVLNYSRAEGRHYLGVDEKQFVILVYGGSRGALKVNQAVAEYLLLSDLPRDSTLLFVTGEIYYRDILKSLEPLPATVKVFPYLEQMPAALAAADLVIARSGATTLAELTALGLPAILIPSPNVVNNHQYYNAQLLATAGAAILLEEKDLNRGLLAQEIQRLATMPEIRAEMAARSRKLGIGDAAQSLYRSLREVAS